MNQYETILVEQQGRVGWITLNRPHRRNAISTRMLSMLSDALTEADRSVTTLLLPSDY